MKINSRTVTSRWLFSIGAAWLFLLSSPLAAVADPLALTPVSAGWLETLNYYRVAAGLLPVAEEQIYNDGVMKHMIYLAKTDPSLFAGQYQSAHSENPASPYATKEGITTGAGNIFGAPDDSESRAIDAWLGAPFHSIATLHEDMTATGFARYRNERTGSFETGMSNGTRTWAPRTKNILFPAPDSTSRLYAWAGESPDPREACGPNYQDYKGLAIYASLLSAPSPQTSITLTLPDGKIISDKSDLCLIDEHNLTTTDPIHGSAAKYLIKAENMVLFFPKVELQPGLHIATINQPDRAPIIWKFTIIERYASHLPFINFDLNQSSFLSWQKVKSSPNNPMLGYQISEWRGNATAQYRVQNEEFDATQLMPGNVNLCVNPLATLTNNQCDLFWSLEIPDFTRNIQWKPKAQKSTVIMWNPINPNSQQHWSKYEVIMRNPTGQIKSEQISQSFFDTKFLPDGKYQICVHALNETNAGECASFNSWEIHQSPPQKQSLIITRPNSNKVVRVGQTIGLSSLSQASSATVFTPGVCKATWVGEKLNVKGLKAGTCTVLFEALGDDKYLAFKEKISLKFTR